jgi:hypothetical protein
VVVVADVKVDVSTGVNVGPLVSAASDKPGPAPGKGAPIAAAGSAGKTGAPAKQPADDQEEDLFELHVRLRRTPSGVDVLLAGTTPSPQGAAATAAGINLVREHGLIGLTILPLVVKANPEASRVLRSAWGSIKAEARGAKLTLTASIPNEAIAAGREVVDAGAKFVAGLFGRN